jgi:hypothetical protein
MFTKLFKYFNLKTKFSKLQKGQSTSRQTVQSSLQLKD